LEKYLKTLTSLLTPQEIDDLDKLQHGTKIELVYLGVRGLCLNSDRTHCYVPEKYSKREKYLKLLIKNMGKPMSAREIIKNTKQEWIPMNSSIVINQEMNKMNEVIKSKLRLGLEKDVISPCFLNTENYKIIKG
jgi:hypothetical protein